MRGQPFQATLSWFNVDNNLPTSQTKTEGSMALVCFVSYVMSAVFRLTRDRNTKSNMKKIISMNVRLNTLFAEFRKKYNGKWN